MSDSQYHSLLENDQNEEDQHYESNLNIFGKKVRNNGLNQDRILTSFRFIPKMWSIYCTTRAAMILIGFVTLLYLVTLFKSQNGPKRTIPPPIRQPMVHFNVPTTTKIDLTIENQHQRVNAKLPKTLPKPIQLNDSDTLQLAEHDSNFAATFWNQWNNFDPNKAERYPSVNYCDTVQMVPPYQIHQNNIYWQLLKVKAEQNRDNAIDIYLYNAYYDNRLTDQPAVKLISATNRQIEIEKRTLWCLLWFDQLKAPVLSNVTEVYDIWPEYWGFGVKDGVYGPQIITCLIPNEYHNQVPKAVSIQQFGNCNQIPTMPSNILRVINNQRAPNSKNPSIGVCVQAFRFRTYDMSVRLVEWLEMVRLLGADKVYLYVMGASDNMYRVLRHYDKDGLVDWRRLTLPGDQPNLEPLYNFYAYKIGGKFWPQELLELNDCLYRNLFRHDYVAIFDIDEVIMPQNNYSWHQMLNQIQSKLSNLDRQNKAYYVNQHAYVYEMWEEDKLVDRDRKSPLEMPDFLYTMRHTYRSNVFLDGSNVKCFHRTDLVTAVHNHFPMRCINTTGHHTCSGHTIDPKQSIMMHYRRDRSPPNKNCTAPTPQCAVHDRTAWRYFDDLNLSVSNQLDKLFP